MKLLICLLWWLGTGWVSQMTEVRIAEAPVFVSEVCYHNEALTSHIRRYSHRMFSLVPLRGTVLALAVRIHLVILVNHETTSLSEVFIHIYLQLLHTKFRNALVHRRDSAIQQISSLPSSRNGRESKFILWWDWWHQRGFGRCNSAVGVKCTLRDPSYAILTGESTDPRVPC